MLLQIATLVLSLGCALAIDLLCQRFGLTPPAFEVSPGREDRVMAATLRRAAAIVLLTVVCWVGIFGALATLGAEPLTDFSQVGIEGLFALHFVFVVAVALWYALGFAGFPGHSWVRQFGLASPSIGREIGVGLLAGLAAWFTVLAILVMLGLAVAGMAGADALPQEPPAMIPWIASLPVWVRVAVSLSAGTFEELFFRGFLQPRIGIAFSTALFVLAHANYEQPIMLIGIGLLSLVFAGLVRWRQNIWPAIAAHALFDAIQLLAVVPMALDFLEEGGPSWLPVARLAGVWMGGT